MTHQEPGESQLLSAQAVEAVEYESMLLGRHLSLLGGRGRRHGKIDRSAYTLLARIRVGPMSIGELARVTGLDASTINRQTAEMRRKGLLTRRPEHDRGLVWKLRVTNEGERLYQEQRAMNIRALGRVLEGWSNQDVLRFAELMGLFNRRIEEISGLVWDGP